MNVEDNYDSPQEPPGKKGGGLLKFCAFGCLILLLLCAVGAAITWFTAGDYIKLAWQQGMMHSESIQIALEADEVTSRLGEPVAPEGIAFPEVTQDGNVQTQVFKVNLKGPDGTGVLHVEYVMDPEKGVERTRFEVEIDGEVFDLSESDQFDVKIDDGMDEELSESEAEVEVEAANESDDSEE